MHKTTVVLYLPKALIQQQKSQVPQTASLPATVAPQWRKALACSIHPWLVMMSNSRRVLKTEVKGIQGDSWIRCFWVGCPKSMVPFLSSSFWITLQGNRTFQHSFSFCSILVWLHIGSKCFLYSETCHSRPPMQGSTNNHPS